MKPPKAVRFGSAVYLEGIEECYFCDNLVPYFLLPRDIAFWPIICINCDPRFEDRDIDAVTAGPLSVHVYQSFEGFI